VFSALHAENAYINTLDTDLQILDGFVSDYAEIRNGNHETEQNKHTVIIDNDYRRLLPATVQLYTAQTGNFALTMGEKITLDTPTPIIHYEWGELANTYGGEEDFVRLGLKETELRQKTKDYYAIDNLRLMSQNLEPIYDVWQDNDLFSNVKIVNISRLGATIINSEHWQVGDERELELIFDDVNVKLKCVVVKVEHNLAMVKFTDMPASIANKLSYRYMKMVAN
jgi:hypothetical protein